MTGRILFIDDDAYSMALYVQALEMIGLDVDQAATVEDALNLAKQNRYHAIVLDLMLPPGDQFNDLGTQGGFLTGAKLIQPLRKAQDGAVFIGLSNSPDSTAHLWFAEVGGLYCRKTDYPPFEFAEKVRQHVGGQPVKPRAFIVHGHDEASRLQLKNFLQNRLHFDEPLILSELPSRGRTIMEKFEEHARSADIAFALLTPDDFITDDSSGRARQNVIFELGYFLGALGRKTGRVFVLRKGNVEIPSDLQGVVYIDITDGIESAAERIRIEIEALP
jgi:CheY-like chemotaxis protein